MLSLELLCFLMMVVPKVCGNVKPIKVHGRGTKNGAKTFKDWSLRCARGCASGCWWWWRQWWRLYFFINITWNGSSCMHLGWITLRGGGRNGGGEGTGGAASATSGITTSKTAPHERQVGGFLLFPPFALFHHLLKMMTIIVIDLVIIIVIIIGGVDVGTGAPNSTTGKLYGDYPNAKGWGSSSWFRGGRFHFPRTWLHLKLSLIWRRQDSFFPVTFSNH